MRVLFFPTEQYVSFEDEIFNDHVRLPVLHCGAVTEAHDYVFQRVLRRDGREAMNRGALAAVEAFRPDLVIYSVAWPHECPDPWVFQEIMAQGVPVFTQVWDTEVSQQPWELEWFNNCSYCAIPNSVTNYLKYRDLAATQAWPLGVVFNGGHSCFTDLFRPLPREKRYDVTLLGSNEGRRPAFLEFLRAQLTPEGIGIHKLGGCVDSTVGSPHLGLTDKWVSLDRYVEIINESHICLCSQTVEGRLQIKSKIFHFLACGVLCMTDVNSETQRVIPDDCLVTFTNEQDCADKIRYYMAHPAEREKIAKAGYDWYHAHFNYKTFWSNLLRAVTTGDVPLPEFSFDPFGPATINTRLEAKPDRMAAYGQMAHTLSQMGRAYGTEAALQQALEHDPDSAKFHNNLAVLYWTLGSRVSARRHMEWAVQLAPKQRDIAMNAAVMRP